MEAGLYVNPQTTGPDNDLEVIKGVIEHVKVADRVGFNAAWLTEHCFTGYNAYSDPIVLGAHVTAIAPSMHIGFAVAIPALHHPIRFANQCALLDNLTGGKLIAAVGSGAGTDEFEGYGMHLADKQEIMDAWEPIVLGAWQHDGKEPFHYESKWWSGTLDGRIIPSPVRKPHPLFARASLTPAKVRQLGLDGRPLLLSLSAGAGQNIWNIYIEALYEADITTEQRETALNWSGFTQQTYISDGPNPAAEVWEYSKYYLHRNVRANNGVDRATPELWDLKKKHYKTGTANMGSSQQVLDKLAPWAEHGMRHTMVWPYFGHMPPALAAETIQRFGEEVLPHLQKIKAEPNPWPVVNKVGAYEAYERLDVAAKVGPLA